jgi:hypothetical protein
MNSMFISLCEFSIISEYDEMTCIIIFGVFYNVFWSVDFGYMKWPWMWCFNEWMH